MKTQAKLYRIELTEVIDRSVLDEIDRSMLDENRTIFGSMHLTTSFLASVKLFER
jgi:hypothetical protein